jgi:hypothetical protein
MDNPISQFGQTRFKISPDRGRCTFVSDPACPPDATTTLFALRLSDDDAALKLDQPGAVPERGTGYEFTIKGGFTQKGVALGSAPSSIAIFKSDSVHYALISDASVNEVAIYDVDDNGIYDTL